MFSLLLPTKNPILQWGVLILLPVVLLIILDNRNFSALVNAVFPHGLPNKQSWEDRPTCGQVDLSNDSLRAKHGKFTKIVERRDDNDDKDDSKPLLLQSPETIMVHPLDGTLYTVTSQGYLISLTDMKTVDATTLAAHTQIVHDLGPGRPLGGKFTADGTTLYIADAMLGLLRIQNVTTSPHSQVEIVVSHVVDELAQPHDASYSYPERLGFADDLTIGPETGKVYFTDASRILPPRNTKDGTYDVMYASKVDLMIGQPTGRLLEYDPLTNQVRILARDLSFANGIAVDANEEYLVFVETFRLAIAKYYLKGPKEGTIEYIVKGFPSPACKYFYSTSLFVAVPLLNFHFVFVVSLRNLLLHP